MLVVIGARHVVYLKIYRHEHAALRFLTARQHEAVDLDRHLIRRVVHGVGQGVVENLSEPHLLTDD